MRRILATLTLGFVLLILIGPSALNATAPPAPLWSAQFLPAVGYGDYLDGNVTGPVNGTFFLMLNAEPFNLTPPIYDVTERMGSRTVLNLSLPTDELTLGMFQLTLLNGSSSTGNRTVFYRHAIQVLDPLNATYVNQQIYLLEAQAQALEGQIQGLSNDVNQLTLQNDILFWVFFALFIFIILGEVIKEWLRGNRRRWRQVRAGWFGLWHRPPIQTYSPDIDPIEVVTQRGDEDRKYVSGYCADCKKLHTEGRIVEHLMSAHGRVEPKEGMDYWETTDPDLQSPKEEVDRRLQRLRHPNFRVAP